MKLRKTLNKIITASALLVNCATFHSFAVEVDDLYTAKIKVSSSADDRKKATQKAFKQVLIKVAGSEFVNTNEQINKELRKANNYLNQFSYESVENETILNASFNTDKINSLLQQQKAKIWGKHRPLLTVWLVDENGMDRTIVDDSNSIKQQVVEAAETKGVPVNFPLMDLTDSMQVSASDVWGRFPETLETASQRYLAEAVVVIRISNSSLITEPNILNCGNNCTKPNYTGDWQLMSGKEMMQETLSSSDKDSLINDIVKSLAAHLHSQNSFVYDTEQAGSLDIEIANVDTMKSFVEVSEYLSKLSAIEDVKVIKIKGQKMLFRISAKTNTQAILQILKLQANLVENNDPLAAVDEQETASFIWKG